MQQSFDPGLTRMSLSLYITPSSFQLRLCCGMARWKNKWHIYLLQNKQQQKQTLRQNEVGFLPRREEGERRNEKHDAIYLDSDVSAAQSGMGHSCLFENDLCLSSCLHCIAWACVFACLSWRHALNSFIFPCHVIDQLHWSWWSCWPQKAN